MLGYVTIGTNDLPKAVAFYDALLAVVGGASRYMETERNVAWSFGPDRPGIGVIKPFDGKPATVGNGMMVSFHVDSRAKVIAVHAKALALGGKDEGAPGQRGPGYYGAYYRDLDGNKLCTFTRSET